MSYNGEQYSFIHLYMIYLTNTVRIMYHNIVITLIVKVASSIKMVVERNTVYELYLLQSYYTK